MHCSDLYIYIYIYMCVCVCVCVMNPVCDLTLAHHIDTCTKLRLHVTHGLHFPSTIALITQLSPITHCTNHTTDCTDHTLYISIGRPRSHCRELFATAYISERFPCVFSCWLPGPFTLIWPFAACLFDPACLLDILSVCRLPRPLRCPWLCISLAFVILLLLIKLCLSDLLLFNKAVPASHWPIVCVCVCVCVSSNKYFSLVLILVDL